MPRLFAALVLASIALTGCLSEDITHYPRPDSGADTAVDAAADAADSGTDAVPDAAESGWAGLPCEENLDCGPSPRQCITRAFLDTLGVNPDIQLPGGMCSRLLCSSDDDCGPGGTCFDAAALGAPIQICLAACEDIRGCRWEEGWDCIPLSLVEEGAEGGACVSDSLHIAILCDDGSCDEGGAE